MRFLSNSFQTVCIPAKNFTFFAEISDGKFLRYEIFRETDPAAAILSAKTAGFSGKNIILAATFSDFRIKLTAFPDMPEDELASTLQWEQDTLFPGSDSEMRTHILSHSPEGYRVLAAALPKETIAAWQDAAQKAGKRITHIRPVFSPKNFSTPLAVFLCGNTTSRVLFSDIDGTTIVKTVKSTDEDIFRDIQKNAADFIWCPMTDCDDDAQSLWHEIFNANENVSRETFQKELYLSLALRLTSENPFDFAPKTVSCSTFFGQITESGPWAAAAILSFLIFGAATGKYLWQAQAYREAVAEQTALSDTRAAMQKTLEAARIRKDEMEECRLFFAENGDWQKKLVTLADVIPAGVTVTAIEGEHDIQISGTATKSEDVNTLARLLSLSWDQKVRRESVKREDGRTLLKFTLRAEREVSHAKE